MPLSGQDTQQAGDSIGVRQRTNFGLGHCLTRAQALVDRVSLYSDILNEGLDGLKSVAQLAQGAAAAAVMQDFAQSGVAVCV